MRRLVIPLLVLGAMLIFQKQMTGSMYISEMRGMEQHCMDTACFDAGQKGMSAGCLTHCIISSSKEQVVMLTVLEVSIVYALILLLVFVVLHLVRCCSRGDDWIGLFLRRHTLLGVVLLR